MSDVIRQHISELRAEVEKQYKEGMDAISVLEKRLLGDKQQNVDSAPIAAKSESTETHQYGSHVDKVIEKLGVSSMTIRQLANALPGMSGAQIRAVLYSSRLKSQVSKKRTKKGIVFKLKSNAKLDRKRPMVQNSASSTILGLIEKSPDGMTVRDVTKALEGKIGKANTISSALYKLKLAGRISYDATTRRYCPPSPSA